MKDDIDYFDDSDTDNKVPGSKNLIQRQAFVKNTRNLRRKHSNSILNELRLNEKINQGDFFCEPQTPQSRFGTSRKNSIALVRSKKKMSDFNINLQTRQSSHKHNLSQFVEPCSKGLIPPINLSHFSNWNKLQKKLDQTDTISTKSKEDKLLIIKSPERKVVHHKKPSNLLLSSINTKLREIDLISKRFDKLNNYCTVDTRLAENQKYNKQCQQTSNILKEFQSKLSMRKNKVNQRRNSLKKKTKIDYRYKVLPKRYQTECDDKQNYDFKHKFHGLWNENARKLKNYITGGYTDQKEDYSDFCDIQEYRRLKNNFKTFEQIYNNIKEDKDNPIGKVFKSDFKQPNILEVVSAMEKQQQLLANKLF